MGNLLPGTGFHHRQKRQRGHIHAPGTASASPKATPPHAPKLLTGMPDGELFSQQPVVPLVEPPKAKAKDHPAPYKKMPAAKDPILAGPERCDHSVSGVLRSASSAFHDSEWLRCGVVALHDSACTL